MKHTSFLVWFSQCYLVILRHKDWEAFLHLLWHHWSFSIQRCMSILYQYHNISFLVHYGGIYVLVCIWCLYYKKCSYFHRKWNLQSEFKSWLRLFVFHICANVLRKSLNSSVLLQAMGKIVGQVRFFSFV